MRFNMNYNLAFECMTKHRIFIRNAETALEFHPLLLAAGRLRGAIGLKATQLKNGH